MKLAVLILKNLFRNKIRTALTTLAVFALVAIFTMIMTVLRFLENAMAEMSTIAGQKAVSTVSRKDISNFKLRKGMPIGARVTLRGDKMYEVLDRLIAVSLPRTRDFRGVPAKGFDGRGNFTMGVKEQIIFPEIDIDKVTKMQGMDITFVTTANTDAEAKALLTAFGFPFSDKDKK